MSGTSGITLNPPDTPTGAEELPAKYWAFISYSHRDRKWGEWLHRELETFRIPKRLRHITPRRDPLPEKLFPVFRDREELPVSADLGKNIEEALRLSRFLIVICSPGAAHSRWVNEEILTFKRLGRSDRILALIVDGEPNASEGKLGFEPDQECFPEALRYAMGPDGKLGQLHAEPIAADARPGQDGRENSLLKLLAGLLGVNYDDLRQREHERKLRRLRAIVAATFTLLLVFAALGVALYFQRNYARAQHERAESALAQVRQTLSRSDYLQAVDAVAKGATPEALAYLARSVRTHPQNESATDLLVSILAYRRWPLLVSPPLPLGKEVGPAVFNSDASKVFFAEGLDHWRIVECETARPVASGVLPAKRLATAVFSPDDRSIVTISGLLGETTVAQAWDVESGRPQSPAFDLKATVTSIAITPDGRKILVPANNQVEMHDLQSGTISEPRFPLDNIILAAAISPDGSHVVGNQIFETVLFDSVTGHPIGQPWKHDAIPQSYTFSPDGKMLGIVLGDSSARLWDVETGEPIGESLKHRSDLTALRFDQTGQVVLTASRDATAVLWDARTGMLVMEPMRHSHTVIAATFGPGERTVLAVSGGEGKPAELQKWDIKRNAHLEKVLPHEDRVVTMALHPRGQLLLSGTADGSLRLWNMRERSVAGAPPKMDGEIKLCTFDPSGDTFAASAGNTVTLWNTATAKPVAAPLVCSDLVTSIEFSSDGTRFLVASLDGFARLWNVRDFTSPVAAFKHEAGVTAAALSPDGQRLVTGSNDKAARLWDVKTGKLLGAPMQHESEISVVRFSHDGRMFATGGKDGVVQLWNTEAAQSLAPPLVHEREITGLLFSADAKTITVATGEPGGQGTTRIWSTHTGKPISDPMLHPDGVISMAFDADTGRLATGSFDGSLRIWDSTVARPRFAPIRFEDPIVRLEFNLDGRQLVVASGSTITLIDLIDPRVVAPGWLVSLAEQVGGLSLSDDGVLVPVADRFTATLRQQLQRHPSDDAYGRFGRWFFSLPPDNGAANPPREAP